jgi:hypothetical protein
LSDRCPNAQCEGIFDIYASRPFQWHQEHPNARCFGSCYRALNVRESRRTPNPQLFQVLGFTPTLGQVRVATESLTLQFSAQLGVVGGWRGGFFLKLYLVWRVDSPCPLGQWTVDFPCKFYLGAGGRIYFPFRQWEGPRCLAFIPFKFGGQEGFFFHFSLFPNVFSQFSL